MRRLICAGILISTLSVSARSTPRVGFQDRALTIQELQLAGDSLPRDRTIFERAYRQANASVAMRATAVRLIGRMETTFPDRTAAEAWLGAQDADASVRREAANAIGQGHAADATLTAAESMKVNARDRAFIDARLETERDESVCDLLLRSLGRLHFDAAGTTAIERELVSETKGSPIRTLGALTGLVTLTAPRDVKTRIEPATRARLRELVMAIAPAAGASADTRDAAVRVRRVVRSNLLQTLNDTDAATIIAASKGPDWQVVRRFAVMMMTASALGDSLKTSLEPALTDEAFQVRWEALRIASRGVTGTAPCTALIRAIDDREPIVRIQKRSRCSNLPAPNATRLSRRSHRWRSRCARRQTSGGCHLRR